MRGSVKSFLIHVLAVLATIAAEALANREPSLEWIAVLAPKNACLPCVAVAGWQRAIRRASLTGVVILPHTVKSQIV